MKNEILAKITSRALVCGTVGLGYVGLPLAVEKAKAGFKTIGFDIQQKKVDMVNSGHNYIGDVVQEDLLQLVLVKCLKRLQIIRELVSAILLQFVFQRLWTFIKNPILHIWLHQPRRSRLSLKGAS